MKLLSILTESIKEQIGVGLWGQDPRLKDTPVGRDYTKKDQPILKKEPEKISGVQIGGGGTERIDPENQYLYTPSSRKGSPFGERNNRPHLGNDYQVSAGTLILHLKYGKILRSGNINPDGWGNTIEIKNEDGDIVRYCHLSQIYVSAGDTIDANTIIGATGGDKGAPGAGNSEGAHLHFEYLKGNSNVDPSSGGLDNQTFKFLDPSDRDKIKSETIEK
jgi:murein DD-endopeptidase MepM/ murein hydrolase activator NlpD